MRLAFGEVASVVLTGQKVIPQKLIESGYEFKFSNLEDTLYDILK
jgi:NAD dependent epimerase/dehydratase family enzyme